MARNAKTAATRGKPTRASSRQAKSVAGGSLQEGGSRGNKGKGKANEQGEDGEENADDSKDEGSDQGGWQFEYRSLERD